MKYGLLLVALVYLSPVAAEQQYDDQGQPCEEAVDLAERGQFHRLHFECAKKPELVSEQSEPDAPVHKPGAEYQARALYAKPEDINQALVDLFGQMQNACAKGWSKDKEWVAMEAGHLAIYYQFTCASL